MNASEDLANAVENATDAAATAGDPAEAGSPPPSAALIRCTEFRALTTQAHCDDLKQQQRELEAGIAAFNPPRRMTLDEPTRVTLPIGRAIEARDVVASAGGAPGQAVTVDVRIGRYMTAKLSGSAFEIVPIGDAQRDLGASTAETWEWDVTPTARGPQSLRVEIDTFAEYDGRRTRISLFRSNPVAVDVDVTGERARKDVMEQVSREIGTSQTLLGSLTAWLGSLAALILAAGVVWWRLRNFGRKARDDDPKPE